MINIINEKLIFTVRVSSMFCEENIVISCVTTGDYLFDYFVKRIGLMESKFFALQYTDSKGDSVWLDLQEPIITQDIKKECPLQFYLRVKFYPEKAEFEIVMYETKRLFFVEVKNAIISSEIYCPPQISVLLASYDAQAFYGDRKDFTEGAVVLPIDNLLPQRIIKQYSFSKAEWNEMILKLWQQCGGLKHERALVEYFKIAQELQMYGVNYFEIRNRAGKNVLLGIHSVGFNVYERSNKLTPKALFLWSEVIKISISKKKLTLKFIDKESSDYVCHVADVTTIKQMYDLCKCYHDFYAYRRRPKTNQDEPIATPNEDELDDIASLEQPQKEINRSQSELTPSDEVLLRLKEPFSEFKILWNRYQAGNMEVDEEAKHKKKLRAKIAELQAILADNQTKDEEVQTDQTFEVGNSDVSDYDDDNCNDDVDYVDDDHNNEEVTDLVESFLGMQGN